MMNDIVFGLGAWACGLAIGFGLDARSWFKGYRRENDQLREVIATLRALAEHREGGE